MTRIGRVKTWNIPEQGTTCFRLVVEQGKVTLGCWHYVRIEAASPHPEIPWMTPQAVYERVS